MLKAVLLGAICYTTTIFASPQTYKCSWANEIMPSIQFTIPSEFSAGPGAGTISGMGSVAEYAADATVMKATRTEFLTYNTPEAKQEIIAFLQGMKTQMEQNPNTAKVSDAFWSDALAMFSGTNIVYMLKFPDSIIPTFFNADTALMLIEVKGYSTGLAIGKGQCQMVPAAN